MGCFYLKSRLNVFFWPILLKKLPIVSTADKFAREIEIFTLSRGSRARFSRSSTSKKRFQRSVCPQSGSPTVFNRVGLKQKLTQHASVGVLGAKTKAGTHQNLRKTHPTGHGLPFAYARISVHFAIIQNCIFLLITMAYEILRESMGC